MMKKVKIGMIQMEVVFDKAEENIMRASELVKQAVKEGAQICVLPECMDLGWGNPDAYEMAFEIPGRTSDAYCRIARENGVYLVAGLTEKADDRVFNTALLISSEGEILQKHRKINVLTGVEDVYSIGDRIGVVQTPFGVVGIDICADNAVQSLSVGYTLGRMGAQMILSPSAWAVTPERDPVAEPYGQEWHVPYGRLSGAFGIPVVGVSNVGQVTKGSWKGWKAIGDSIAYDSDGSCLAVLPYGEDAQCVRVIEITVKENPLKGTALAEKLYDMK